MNILEKTALKWHLRSDHARDGAKFGSPTCNCMNVAKRMLPLLAEAWENGHDAATDSSPGDVWFAAWTDNPNPYEGGRHVGQ